MIYALKEQTAINLPQFRPSGSGIRVPRGVGKPRQFGLLTRQQAIDLVLEKKVNS